MKNMILLFFCISFMTASCKKTKRNRVAPAPDKATESGIVELKESTVPGYSPSTLNFRQLPDSLIAMAGITNQNDIDAVYREWENHKNQLPKEGAISEITPAAWNATFFLAAQVCDSIKNFPTSNDITDVSQFFSSRFLGRPLVSDEIAVFVALASELERESIERRNQLVCTVIASSSEALKI